MVGRKAAAREVFERVLACHNGLGLYPARYLDLDNRDRRTGAGLVEC
ncbi:MAG: hypothetical protein U1E73_06825 [Planctomycetota bacterium]